MMKIALVGYGYWGPNVARNLYNNKSWQFCTICDKLQTRLDKAKELYANALQYETDYDTILQDTSIEAVALAVETSAHYELAEKALLAGKHVYIEKPITDNIAQAIQLKKLAEEKNLRIHVDHIMVFHPVIKKIKELIDSGEIGDLIWIDCSRLNLGQIKNDVSSMWDLSVHDLAIVEYLTGGATAVDVKAMGIKMYSCHESVTQLMVKYDSFFSTMRASWISPIKERKLIIAGTKKMIIYDDVDVLNKLIVYDKGFDMKEGIEYSEYVAKARNGGAIIPELKIEDALYNSLEHFRQAIVTGTESITNADAAIRVVEILEKADKTLQAVVSEG